MTSCARSTDGCRRTATSARRSTSASGRWESEMATDDERREVARRLREAASHYESMERDVDFYPVESALGLKPTGETAYTPESVRSLADLIEPSGHECVPGECSLNVRHDSDFIDRDALLSLADEMDRVGYNDWLHSGEWEPEEIARRIRGVLERSSARTGVEQQFDFGERRVQGCRGAEMMV